jgi:hypothetical protein
MVSASEPESAAADCRRRRARDEHVQANEGVEERAERVVRKEASGRSRTPMYSARSLYCSN